MTQSATPGEAAMFTTLKTVLNGIGVAGDMADVYAERMVGALTGLHNSERRRQLIEACIEVDVSTDALAHMTVAGNA